MRTLARICALLLALAATTARARTFEEIKAAGTIVVASEGAFPPFNFFQGGKLAGFEIEIAEALAGRMGVAVEWRALPFDALLAGLRQDRWDLVIASFGVTPERARAVTFTDPHYCGGGVIVTRDPAVRTVADLAGKTIAVQTGTTYLEHVKRLAGHGEVKNFPRDTDARAALVAGRVQVWVTDKFVARRALEADPGAGLRLGDFVFVEQVACAVKTGNGSLQRAVNRALAEILADGTYRAISMKWMKEDIRCR
jgi:polar amino acid transport system substrate-binding protein